VQVLVKAVTADLATKKPAIICEGLLEIAEDLAALDPRQANALLDKAREVAGTTGLRLGHYQTRVRVPAAA
jgi:hypothetical protein